VLAVFTPRSTQGGQGDQTEGGTGQMPGGFVLDGEMPAGPPGGSFSEGGPMGGGNG
jgi:hypothetical protein